MARVTVSFFLALFCHIILLQQSLSWQDETAPALISDSSISVSLNEAPEVKPKVEQVETKPPQPKERPPLPPPPKVEKPQPEKTDQPEVVAIESTVKKKRVPLPEPTATRETQKMEDKVESREDRTDPDNLATDSSVDQPRKDSPDHESTEKAADAVSAVIEAKPLYQFNPKPEYPDFARRRGWQGVVSLKVEVTADGKIASVSLLESCGYKVLDKSALQTVKCWRFTPGTKEGKNSYSTVIIPVHFKLTSE